MAATIRCDVAIVGAGLAGGLLALALAARHPTLDLRLIDVADVVGGNHIWSFFGSDVAQADRWIVEPLVCHGWRAYDVAFPAHARTINQTYYSIESARLDAVVRARLPDRALMLGRKVAAVTPTTVTLADGDRIEATGVIDARGAADLGPLEAGWQKFVGRELVVPDGHGLERPVVMDATVTQLDGYRFVYCLPFSPTRVFVEDTYYSDSASLNHKAVSRRIDAYAAARGWQVAADADGATAWPRNEPLHEERGVLPVVMGGDFDAYWRSGGRHLAKAGMRAGLFHPTTGYSLPDAVRTAAAIARRTDFASAALHDATYALAKATWQARGFYRMLDTMLFRAAEPDERYRVLQRFYRLDPRLIGRFYAGQSTMGDKARVLMGRPPVPVGRAVRALIGSGAGAAR
ncbi:lycopene beta-cyclase CrtY [Sphingomonas rubra]|uniref:Lycopene beta-cyclase n=1 Tax=Sphingomonas rubra TaxID=634430 RepID=A0A1I5TK23_9SPHN|nr:lycopene beta-cyclase CrtY [Sphingomonas rubra]SFP83211.1 lycopene beta-cyclase [Sphingomonas rubra]